MVVWINLDEATKLSRMIKISAHLHFQSKLHLGFRIRQYLMGDQYSLICNG